MDTFWTARRMQQDEGRPSVHLEAALPADGAKAKMQHAKKVAMVNGDQWWLMVDGDG